MSLVRPKLVQWSTSQRILIAKIIKKTKHRQFRGDVEIGGDVELTQHLTDFDMFLYACYQDTLGVPSLD